VGGHLAGRAGLAPTGSPPIPPHGAFDPIRSPGSVGKPFR